MTADIEKLSIDTIRCLAMDAVQKANAGHPGTADGARAGRLRPLPRAHAPRPRRSVLAEPRPLRALGRARVHPAVRRAAPVRLRPHARRPEAVPAVGLAGRRGTPSSSAITRSRASRSRPARSGRASATPSAWRSPRPCWPSATTATASRLVDHRTYAICSDGDVMEGVSGEASSLAGFLGLGKLCLIYDDNHITIEGSTGLAFGEDVGLRYEAYGFHVQRLGDGWTTDDLRAALDAADAETARPSLIIVRTHIAIGAPHAQDTPEAHGAPLGEEEVRLTKQAYGWDPDKHFFVPDEVCAALRRSTSAAPPTHAAWDAVHARRRARPRSRSSTACSRAGCPRAGRTRCPTSRARARRRRARARVRASRPWPAAIPEFVGGSADLAPSTTTTIKGAENVPGAPLSNKENAQADSVLPGRLGGRTFHFGIREHGMGSILNGFTVHGGFRAFGGHVLRVLRLHAASGAACLHHGPARDLRLDARLHRARRGRSDAPADRAPRVAARDAVHAHHPPRRRDGDGRGLAARARAHGRAGRARALAPEAARARPQRARARRAACARAATCWPTPKAARPT